MALFGLGKKTGAISNFVKGLSEGIQDGDSGDLAIEFYEYTKKENEQVAQYYSAVFPKNKPIAPLARLVSSHMNLVRELTQKGAIAETKVKAVATLSHELLSVLPASQHGPFIAFYRAFQLHIVSEFKESNQGNDELVAELQALTNRLNNYAMPEQAKQQDTNYQWESTSSFPEKDRNYMDEKEVANLADLKLDSYTDTQAIKASIVATRQMLGNDKLKIDLAQIKKIHAFGKPEFAKLVATPMGEEIAVAISGFCIQFANDPDEDQVRLLDVANKEFQTIIDGMLANGQHDWVQFLKANLEYLLEHTPQTSMFAGARVKLKALPMYIDKKLAQPQAKASASIGKSADGKGFIDELKELQANLHLLPESARAELAPKLQQLMDIANDDSDTKPRAQKTQSNDKSPTASIGQNDGSWFDTLGDDIMEAGIFKTLEEKYYTLSPEQMARSEKYREQYRNDSNFSKVIDTQYGKSMFAATHSLLLTMLTTHQNKIAGANELFNLAISFYAKVLVHLMRGRNHYDVAFLHSISHFVVQAGNQLGIDKDSLNKLQGLRQEMAEAFETIAPEQSTDDEGSDAFNSPHADNTKAQPQPVDTRAFYAQYSLKPDEFHHLPMLAIGGMLDYLGTLGKNNANRDNQTFFLSEAHSLDDIRNTEFANVVGWSFLGLARLVSNDKQNPEETRKMFPLFFDEVRTLAGRLEGEENHPYVAYIETQLEFIEYCLKEHNFNDLIPNAQALRNELIATGASKALNEAFDGKILAQEQVLGSALEKIRAKLAEAKAGNQSGDEPKDKKPDLSAFIKHIAGFNFTRHRYLQEVLKDDDAKPKFREQFVALLENAQMPKAFATELSKFEDAYKQVRANPDIALDAFIEFLVAGGVVIQKENMKDDFVTWANEKVNDDKVNVIAIFMARARFMADSSLNYKGSDLQDGFIQILKPLVNDTDDAEGDDYIAQALSEASQSENFEQGMLSALRRVAMQQTSDAKKFNGDFSKYDFNPANQVALEDSEYDDIADHLLKFYDNLVAKLNEYIDPKTSHLEERLKDLLYRNHIRITLQQVIFIQPMIIQAMFAKLEQRGKAHYKPLIAMGHLKPFMARYFQHVIYPIGNDKNATKEDVARALHRFNASMNDIDLSLARIIHEPRQLRHYLADASEKETEARRIELYCQWAAFINTSVLNLGTQAFFPTILENDDNFYDRAWPEVCFKTMVTTWDMFGRPDIETFDNQALAMAFLFMFHAHNNNQDVQYDENENIKGMTARYDQNTVPKLAREEVMAASQATQTVKLM